MEYGGRRKEVGGRDEKGGEAVGKRDTKERRRVCVRKRDGRMCGGGEDKAEGLKRAEIKRGVISNIGRKTEKALMESR